MLRVPTAMKTTPECPAAIDVFLRLRPPSRFTGQWGDALEAH